MRSLTLKNIWSVTLHGTDRTFEVLGKEKDVILSILGDPTYSTSVGVWSKNLLSRTSETPGPTKVLTEVTVRVRILSTSPGYPFDIDYGVTFIRYHNNKRDISYTKVDHTTDLKVGSNIRNNLGSFWMLFIFLV